MAQGSQDTLCNWGTADANAIAWRDTVISMVNEILSHGWSGPQDIVTKYGYSKTDWGSKAKIRTADKKNFIG